MEHPHHVHPHHADSPQHHGHTFRIAVADPNFLAGYGLQQLLRSIIPTAEVSVYVTFEELMEAGCEQFVHFFVASRIYFEHALFFRQQRQKSIVMVSGDMMISGVPTLNVCQSEELVLKALVALRRMGHPPAEKGAECSTETILSPREVEVARLLAKGCINKEIADILSISHTTVISHRKNIMEKLHARSLADVIVYAVIHGLVDVGEA